MGDRREPEIDGADTVPYPGWETAIFWSLTLLFCLLFWRIVIAEVLLH